MTKKTIDEIRELEPFRLSENEPGAVWYKPDGRRRKRAYECTRLTIYPDGTQYLQIKRITSGQYVYVDENEKEATTT
jgi:hypothetical protein